MLKLKTNIVFETLGELKEAVELGLDYKDNWLNGTYEFPMVQGKSGNHCHSMVNSLWSGNRGTSLETIGYFKEDIKTWSKARSEYIKPTEELTLEQICKELGRDIKIVK